MSELMHTPAAPPITVAIPFHNSAATLTQAIGSVFAQSEHRWHLLLVDDGSTDASALIASRIDDPRVRLLVDGVNRGLVHRLNQIAHETTTEYLMRMDADDIMHPSRVERQLEYLNTHPSVEVIGSAAYSVDHKLRVRGKRGSDLRRATPAGVVARGLFIHPTVAGRTAWFRRNPYAASFPRAEDHELWCRTYGSAQFGYLPEALLFYREAAGRLESLLASYKTDRTIYRVYGPKYMSSAQVRRLLAVSHLKGLAHRGAALAGCGELLIRRRSQPLAAGERTEATRALHVALSARVPGLHS